MTKPHSTKPARVLLVESSAVERERIRNRVALFANVRIVAEAGTAADALTFFRIVRPDAVIIDVSLPGGGGLRLLHEIKREQPNCIVMILTMADFPAWRARCRELGADYFFEKTSEFEGLIAVLSELGLPPESKP